MKRYLVRATWDSGIGPKIIEWEDDWPADVSRRVADLSRLSDVSNVQVFEAMLCDVSKKFGLPQEKEA